MAESPIRLSIFPLAGAILLPRAQLPLHIFEPRYQALVKDAMARDRRIAMIQPREENGDTPALFDIGCIGKVAEVEAMDDGRFNLILEGLTRFRMVRELDATTPFRQIEAVIEEFGDDAVAEPLSIAMRGGLIDESKKFAAALGYAVDWEAVDTLDDETLVNMIAQVAPFDTVAKQALLEAPTIDDRSELLIQFMQFFRMHQQAGGDDRATLQ
ncbi:ATP-dependent protease [Parasphingopyxis algicola]|uniref:LON peptidase substrate-binding domain-containing protein n=1 Tax=Parasphingopyxis algicola TaxID=2026624 RepID=UPI0015A4145C|nr:LON peptidase substrate-binding domain-containing protein [Parasphingopyxis algicola]QLC25661.1 ATP-dependent protease [Parasphingopyxis algicola]